MISNHYMTDRKNRNDIIKEIGVGKVVESFAVDRGHKDGAEIHIVTTTGLIVIYNRKSLKMVTVLIARPNQISRYYENLGRVAPAYILNIAFENYKKGYNNI